jgi:hypothetical protein
MEQDDRATEPPAENEPEESAETSGDAPREDPSEDPGPRGNPDVDEEALRHSQEEQDAVSGN